VIPSGLTLRVLQSVFFVDRRFRFSYIERTPKRVLIIIISYHSLSTQKVVRFYSQDVENRTVKLSEEVA
jgi:hypothetical protein